MSDDYQGSIAQENVSYNTQVVFSTTPGDNYYKLMLFVGISQAGLMLNTAPSVLTLLTLNKSSFAAETKGRLKDWLTSFFAAAGDTEVYVVVFVDKVGNVWDPAGLTAAMAQYKQLAYWKTMLYLAGGDTPNPAALDYDATAALATLRKADKALTAPILVNEYAVSVLTGAGTSISEQLQDADLDAWSVYHPEGMEKAPVLAQLGVTLGFLNESGTPVGNSVDFVATNVIDASGVDGANLNPTQQTTLKGLKIGYFKTVGNGTGMVALIGGESLLGNFIGADWVTEYCDYVNEIKTAELITTINAFKNRKTYSQILAQLSAQLERFGDTAGTGRLKNILITAPVFSKLPVAAGDTIVIPNAWSATYVDNVRQVQVQGTLVIQA